MTTDPQAFLPSCQQESACGILLWLSTQAAKRDADAKEKGAADKERLAYSEEASTFAAANPNSPNLLLKDLLAT